MTEILAEAVTGLQNIYTPFTAKQHLVFCIFGTTIYLIQYYRNGGLHNLFLMAGIDLTYLTQTSLCNTGDRIGYLGVAEIIILALAGVFSYKFNKEQKAKKAAAGNVEALREAADDAEEERREQIEKEAAEREEDIVNNAFDSDGD